MADSSLRMSDCLPRTGLRRASSDPTVLHSVERPADGRSAFHTHLDLCRRRTPAPHRRKAVIRSGRARRVWMKSRGRPPATARSLILLQTRKDKANRSSAAPSVSQIRCHRTSAPAAASPAGRPTTCGPSRYPSPAGRGGAPHRLHSGLILARIRELRPPIIFERGNFSRRAACLSAACEAPFCL